MSRLFLFMLFILFVIALFADWWMEQLRWLLQTHAYGVLR